MFRKFQSSATIRAKAGTEAAAEALSALSEDESRQIISIFFRGNANAQGQSGTREDTRNNSTCRGCENPRFRCASGHMAGRSIDSGYHEAEESDPGDGTGRGSRGVGRECKAIQSGRSPVYAAQGTWRW